MDENNIDKYELMYKVIEFLLSKNLIKEKYSEKLRETLYALTEKGKRKTEELIRRNVAHFLFYVSVTARISKRLDEVLRQVLQIVLRVHYGMSDEDAKLVADITVNNILKELGKCAKN